MAPRTVYIATDNSALRRGLLAQFDQEPELFFVPELASHGLMAGDVLVSTPSDTPAARCAELAAEGVQVVILAPVPRERDHQRYRRAGAAAYLPMLVEHGRLLDEVQKVADAAASVGASSAVP